MKGPPNREIREEERGGEREAESEGKNVRDWEREREW